jgi:hypothetical protein
MGAVVPAQNRRLHPHVARIQTEVLPGSGVGSRPYQLDCVQSLCEKLRIMRVGPADA